MRNLHIVGAVAAALLAAAPASAQTQRWVSSWGTALDIATLPRPDLPPPPPEVIKALQGMKNPIAPAPETLNNETIRMVARTSLGGRAVRVQLSNAQGKAALQLGSAHVAIRGQGAAIKPGTDRAVTFAGKPSVTIPPGAIVVSDPVDLPVTAFQELAVSLFLPGATGGVTSHPLGLLPAYIVRGDATGATDLADPKIINSYFWLAGVEVLAETPTGVIVAFGDSITDGFTSTPGAHRTWPEVLAERLHAATAGQGWAVINMGISGNRIRRDGAGSSALARFDRDVLNRPGVEWIVMLEGINDICLTVYPGAPAEEHATADQIIEAYSLFIDKAHLHGIKVMGATIMPTEGHWLHTPESEAMRQAVNQWILTGGKFDAVADFDTATRDPARPARLRPEFDPGDHIHPNDAGNAAMAAAIDLKPFLD